MENKIQKSSSKDLPKSVKELFSKEEFAKILILKRLSIQWKDIVGEVLGDFTQPKDFSNDSLIIQTTHAAYSQEIHFYTQKILDAFHSLSGKKSVKKVFCTIGPIKKNRSKSISKKTKSLEGKENLISSLERIEDPELKNKLMELIQVLD